MTTLGVQFRGPVLALEVSLGLGQCCTTARTLLHSLGPFLFLLFLLSFSIYFCVPYYVPGIGVLILKS